jgi:hypothetical protein
MMAKDAGVEYLRVGPDGIFEVRFPAPQPVAPAPVVVKVATPGISGEAQTSQSGYDKLFRGNKPTLGKAAE